MAAPLTLEEVAKAALLARLKLTDDELKTLTAQLGRVLGYVDILNEVDTENVEPMAHAVEVTNVLRDDVTGKSLSRDDALSNAPMTDGKSFLVPQIIEGAS